MNLNLQVINPLFYPGWDDLILSTQDYSFFHTSSWAKVISKAYGYTPSYFVLMDKKKLHSLFPVMEINSRITGKRGVSLPFSDNCEPILSDEEHFGYLLNNILSHGEKLGWKYLEIRGGDRFFLNTPFCSSYVGYTLDLSRSENEIFGSFRSSTRRNVRKAKKEGVKTEICCSSDSVKKFYSLHCVTRKNHGLPPQPFRFFKNIYKYIISPKKGCIVLASYEDKTVAGAVFFHFGEKVIYKYGASDKAYQHLRANNLVMWTAIRHYITEGKYNIFDMGRTNLNNKGLQQFKAGWGTRKKEILYYRYHIGKENFESIDQVSPTVPKRLFCKIPIPVLKLIGHFFYGHIG